MVEASLSTRELGLKWHELFSRYAEDLYPGRYTANKCLELAEQAVEILRLAEEKESTIVAHNYLFPEFHEIAEKVGDSLGLSFYVQKKKAPRVDFESVFFMGATAKIITGNATRVFVSDSPEVLGCSLVFGIDYDWLDNWKRRNPDGVLVTYVNSDAYTKSISDFIATSRNTDRVIVHAVKMFPGRKILVLPDKYLGYVMKARALEQLSNEGIKIDPDLIEVYEQKKGQYWAACHVHQQIGPDAADIALLENDDAELMIHPECGCASSCLYKVQKGEIPHSKAYFLSTEQMIERAKISSAKKFVVATEKGMVYRLRKEMPQKEFIPISSKAECGFMKANTFDKLLASLREDKVEIVYCDDCCDPRSPYQDDRVVHIPRTAAEAAIKGISRMLAIG
ncbi:MAG: quinolinate synthase NadA [Bacteroidetes bacterium]|nr:quinolinate synthase NadA [Bacteroidota bacterium]